MCLILYHGTPEPLGAKILQERIIRNSCERMWNGYIKSRSGEMTDISTTDGFVYLSSKLSLAAFYGSSNRMKCEGNPSEFYVFRIEIPIEELLPDYDELKINWNTEIRDISAEQSLSICSCACSDHSLDGDLYDIEYIKVDVRDFHSLLSKTILNLCKEFKNTMEPDPSEILHKIDNLGNWIKL